MRCRIKKVEKKYYADGEDAYNMQKVGPGGGGGVRLGA